MLESAPAIEIDDVRNLARKESPAMEPQESTAAATQDNASEVPEVSSETAAQFVGQWNKLVSTTNWEKGRIICNWREALINEGAPVTDYSDEAWAQLVGGVTSQHVGRLRRVYQRFGEVVDQYAGLFWSHFQAALDWDDAEMWLEGSIQNDWSVSQMRGKRWETHGTPPEQQRQETDLDNSEIEGSDAPFAEEEAESSSSESAIAPTSTTIDSTDNDKSKSEETEKAASADSSTSETDSESETVAPVEKRTRLNVDVESLPDDLAEAFESFKLAIIAHRRENWRDTSTESVLECLDALRQLVLADEE